MLNMFTGLLASASSSHGPDDNQGFTNYAGIILSIMNAISIRARSRGWLAQNDLLVCYSPVW